MKKYWIFLLCALTLPFGLLRAQTTIEHTIVRLDPSLNAIVAPDAELEKLIERNSSFEGPTWFHDGNTGYFIFSDVPGNVIYKVEQDGKISVFLDHLFTGKDNSDAVLALGQNYYMLGANGTTLDRQGRLVYCEYSDGQIVRLEKDGRRTVLAGRFDGKRLNGTNDLVYKSDGSLYFTDSRESTKRSDGEGVPHKGLYLLKDGKVQLLTKDISHPNGLAFTPDEKYFYANNTDLKTIMKYEVQPDDTIANPKVFIDMSDDKAPGAPDGMKVDKKGNVYSTGPGGVWIISPTGKHLGTILTPRATNMTFGGDDAKTLYITGASFVARIPLKAVGIRP